MPNPATSLGPHPIPHRPTSAPKLKTLSRNLQCTRPVTYTTQPETPLPLPHRTLLVAAVVAVTKGSDPKLKLVQKSPTQMQATIQPY